MKSIKEIFATLGISKGEAHRRMKADGIEFSKACIIQIINGKYKGAKDTIKLVEDWVVKQAGLIDEDAKLPAEKPDKVEVVAKGILKILTSLGINEQEKALTSKNISTFLYEDGIMAIRNGEERHVSKRTIGHAIEELRDAGYMIGSSRCDPWGYWLISNDQEFMNFMGMYESTIDSMRDRKKKMLDKWVAEKAKKERAKEMRERNREKAQQYNSRGLL